MNYFDDDYLTDWEIMKFKELTVYSYMKLIVEGVMTFTGGFIFSRYMTGMVLPYNPVGL